MNRMTKKRVGMVLAFSLTLTGAAAYIGIQQGNTDKTETAGSLTAGVSASLNASEVEALDVTAGVTSQLYDKTDVAVAANEKQMVAQGIEDTQTKEAVSENTTEDTSICGYKNLGIAQVQGSLNVRKKASTDSKVVGKMTDKDACEIVSVKGDWAKITSGKVEGYVKTEYLLAGDAAKNVAKKEITKVVTVNTTTLRVREKASEDSAILSLVGEGEDLVVEDTKDGWYKVEVDDQKGYISGDYVEVTEKLPTASTVKELEYGEGYTDSRVSLVQFALQFVGNRYVWGGTSLTNGIDCSGFTMQVYARYGVGLPHHAASQPAYGKRISASEAKPGDLFFYGSGSSISHVGIYIGNGQIVHASINEHGEVVGGTTGDQTGTEICVRSYYNYNPPWNHVLRYKSGGGEPASDIYIVNFIPA